MQVIRAFKSKTGEIFESEELCKQCDIAYIVNKLLDKSNFTQDIKEKFAEFLMGNFDELILDYKSIAYTDTSIFSMLNSDILKK